NSKLTGFRVLFSQEYDNKTAGKAGNYVVVKTGRDRKFDTNDDVTIPVSRVTLKNNNVVPLPLSTAQPFPLRQSLRLRFRSAIFSRKGKELDPTDHFQNA